MQATQNQEALKRIASSIDEIVRNHDMPHDLEKLAEQAGYESTYFQKLFSSLVGLSPKQLHRYMQHSKAKDLLLEGHTTLESAYQAGLSGNGRLHDLFITMEAATPGEVASKGKGLKLRYGIAPSPIGQLIIAETEKGICWLGFHQDGSPQKAIDRIHKHWGNADITRDDKAISQTSDRIMKYWQGTLNGNTPLRLNAFGTNFQIQVWQALLKIPAGHVISYQSIGEEIGKPKAARAIGSAVGANPISLLIPCHRVIQKSGIVNHYEWGSPRKKTLLGMEGAR